METSFTKVECIKMMFDVIEREGFNLCVRDIRALLVRGVDIHWESGMRIRLVRQKLISANTQFYALSAILQSHDTKSASIYYAQYYDCIGIPSVQDYLESWLCNRDE